MSSKINIPFGVYLCLRLLYYNIALQQLLFVLRLLNVKQSSRFCNTEAICFMNAGFVKSSRIRQDVFNNAKLNYNRVIILKIYMDF